MKCPTQTLLNVIITSHGEFIKISMVWMGDYCNAMACLMSRDESCSKIQQLYDKCNVVLPGCKGEIPPLEEIQWLQDILGTIEPVDVGINVSDDNEDELFMGRMVEDITYIHIHECEKFSIGVFCFPAGAQFPLHDHPEMVVLSRVLYGSALIRAYDWVKTPDTYYKNYGLAKLTTDDQVIDPTTPPQVLFPTSGGNVHTFTALTPCAILDVLSPPYSDEQGRPSTYYSDISVPYIERFAFLKEREVPEDLVVLNAPYLGPDVVVLNDDNGVD